MREEVMGKSSEWESTKDQENLQLSIQRKEAV